MLWDNERNNGSTYYYYPEKSPPECSVINFPVGILRPDWLSGAKYKGVEEYNGHQVRDLDLGRRSIGWFGLPDTDAT